MKKILIALLLALPLIALSGCTNYNELPPKTDDASTSYLVPSGVVPTQAERELVRARLAEYEAALNKE